MVMMADQETSSSSSLGRPAASMSEVSVEIETTVPLARPAGRLSVASSAALGTLASYETRLAEMEDALGEDLDGLISSGDLEGVLVFKKNVEQLVGRAEKLQFNEIDTVTTGGLKSGKVDARAKRKELNKRVNAVVEKAKNMHKKAKQFVDGREGDVVALNIAMKEAEKRQRSSFDAQGSVKGGSATGYFGRWKNPGVREAIDISYVSIAVTLIYMIVGLIVGSKNNSSSMVASALESGVDVVSSILVLWRFWGTQDEASKLAAREKRASVAIAMAFIVISLIVGGTSIAHLSSGASTENAGALIGLAAPTMVVLGFIGALKLHIAKRTGSFAMKKDGVCSLAAAGLSFGIIVGQIIVEASDGEKWRFDAVFALLIAIGLAVYGGRTLVKNALTNPKWYQRGFWTDAAWAHKRDFGESSLTQL